MWIRKQRYGFQHGNVALSLSVSSHPSPLPPSPHTPHPSPPHPLLPRPSPLHSNNVLCIKSILPENRLVARCVVGFVKSREQTPTHGRATVTDSSRTVPTDTMFSEPLQRIMFWCEMSRCVWSYPTRDESDCAVLLFFFVITSDTGFRQPLSLALSDTKVCNSLRQVTRPSSKRESKVDLAKSTSPPQTGCPPRSKAAWEREFELAWREACPPNCLDIKVDSDQ